MIKGREIILSIFISLIIHTVFFALSPHVLLPGMRQVVDQTHKMFRIKAVEGKTADVTLFKDVKARVPKIKMTRQGLLSDNISLQKMMMEDKTIKDSALDEKKKWLRDEQLKKSLPAKAAEFDVTETLKSETKRIKDDIAPKKRQVSRYISGGILATDVVTSDFSKYELTVARGVSSELDKLKASEVIGLSPEAKTEAFQFGESSKAVLQKVSQVGEYEDIGEYLDVNLYTYIDPNTAEKYFKLLISTKKNTNFEVVPKEMIFLIDSSKSITEKKLSVIKEGLLDALTGFNSGDRFNIVAFRGDVVRFKKKAVPVTDRTINEAGSFIKKLKAVGQTNVENALMGIISEDVSFNPSYVVLITDGRPTVGVTSSRRIIQEITRRNNMKRPIFCFGGGMKVNRYLLDFVSYQNRAWGLFSDSTFNMAKDFKEFYKQIKDPLLLNMRYRLNGLDIEGIYPKNLSDFYQGRSFVLYGRFKDEDAFSVQLLGEINGDTKEFIFKKTLKNAQQGNADIAKEWAFRKIYYLISRITMGLGDSEKLHTEISRLSKKYNIITPYDLKEED